MEQTPHPTPRNSLRQQDAEVRNQRSLRSNPYQKLDHQTHIAIAIISTNTITIVADDPIEFIIDMIVVWNDPAQAVCQWSCYHPLTYRIFFKSSSALY